MLYRRAGMPEDDEIVLCTVNNVQPHSVFVRLDEYEKGGMIHISEVAPGRIRNIREFVMEGKKVVCKVLRTDITKGHIDLSLRRVNEGQRRQKLDEIKRELKAEKIIEGLAKKNKLEVNKLYREIADKVLKKYTYVYDCFSELVDDKASLSALGVEKKLADELTDVVKDKIKPIAVTIKGDLMLKSEAPNGIEIVKEVLSEALKAGEAGLEITYKGAGKYNMIVTATDYKEAERILLASSEKALSLMEKKGGEALFERVEQKKK